jgi:hypothetical protein
VLELNRPLLKLCFRPLRLLLFIAQRREFFAELLLSLLQSAAFVLLPSSGGVKDAVTDGQQACGGATGPHEPPELEYRVLVVLTALASTLRSEHLVKLPLAARQVGGCQNVSFLKQTGKQTARCFKREGTHSKGGRRNGPQQEQPVDASAAGEWLRAAA